MSTTNTTKTYTLDDTIQIDKSKKKVSSILKSEGKSGIFSLIKKGYYFDDEVLEKAGIKKTVSEAKIDITSAFEREKIDTSVFNSQKTKKKKKSDSDEDSILTFYEEDEETQDDEVSENTDPDMMDEFNEDDINLMLHPEDEEEEDE